MRPIAVLAAFAGLVAGGFALGAPAARADDLCVHLTVQKTGAPPDDVPGFGPGNCTPTPFPWFYRDSGSVCVTGLPPGTPCGVGWDSQITTP